MALRKPTKAEVQHAWAVANAELDELGRQGPNRDLEREQKLLGVLDTLEGEAGRIEQETPPELRGMRG
jgi:hypothetical protein